MKNFKIIILVLMIFNIGIYKAQENDPPNWSWAKNVEGTSTNIVSDSIGNSYLLGNYAAPVTFGATILSGTGSYVVKYDSTGTVLWARQALSGTSTAKDIKIDGTGNYYLTGYFSGTVNIGGLNRTSAGSNDFFIVKYNQAGTIQFAQQAGGTNSDIANGISIDVNGNVFITGNFVNASFVNEINCIKYNSTGILQWQKIVSNYNGGSGNDSKAIANDQYGNSYVTGFMRNASAQSVFFIMKMDPEGNIVWNRISTSTTVATNQNIDMLCDNSGNTYTSGTFSSSVTFGSSSISSAGLYDAFLLKYDASGQVVWVKSAGGVDNDYGDGLTIDKLGNCFMTGRFQQNANFSSISLSNLNSGISDVYVAKYSALGEILWVQSAGESGADGGLNVSLDQASNCYLNGNFTASITLGSTALTTATTSSFIAKIGSNTIDTLAIFTKALQTLTYTAGSAIDVDFSTTGSFSSNTVFTVELSDASGGFFYPTAIGTGLSSPINAMIPPSAVISSNYRVRVKASNPEITGNDNGSDISINSGGQQITPDWSWANKVSGTNTNIVIDTIGNSYLIGNYSSNVTFGSTTLSGSGSYVVKYDSLGIVIWARTLASGTISAKDIAIDAFGNYYVTGSFFGSGTFGTFSLTSAGGNDIFVVKYDQNGNSLWAQKAGGTNSDIGTGVTVDLAGNVIVVVNLTNTSFVYEINAMKYNSSGVIQWTKLLSSYNTGSYNDVRAVSHDKFGNSYVAGYMRNSATTQSFFLLKLDPSGNTVWNRQTITNGYNQNVELVTDANGNSFLTSTFHGSVTFGSTTITNTMAGTYDLFVVKYDAAGQVTWAKSAGGLDNEYGDAIALDPLGNCYVSGRFQHAAYFGGINISNFNSGVADIFVAKYDNSGNTIWVKQAGETGVESMSKIGVDKFGNSYVSGQFTNSINFDGTQLVGGANTGYLAKIGATYQTSIGKASIIAGLKICSGNVFKIQYPVSGVFASDNIFTAQLSDENGSFATPLVIGTLESSINHTIYAIIPTVPTGSAYRIRVVSSNIALVGPDNGYDLSINMTNCDSVSVPLEAIPLVAFEYFFDLDNGVGTYVEIPVASSDSITLTQSISIVGLSPGFHNLFIRFKDNNSVWSLYEGRIIYVQPALVQTKIAPLVTAEYFFDTDPGLGNGTDLASFTKADNIDLVRQVDVSGLSAGFHNLFIRTKDSLNVWSLYEGRIIYVQPTVVTADSPPLVSGEYFFNSPDPGIGNGFALTSFTKADSIDILSQINTSGLTNGYNNLFIRVKDSLGVWSLYEGRQFFICSDVLETPIISGNPIVCENSDLSLSGSLVTNATSYLWEGPNGFTQAGNDLSLLNVNASANGTYSFYAIRSGGTKCDTSSTTIDVVIKEIFTSNNPQTICEGASFSINGNIYSIAGTYNDTLTAQNGCDSIIVTQLSVIQPVFTNNPQTICEGDSYNINGNTYSAAGTYNDTLQAINSCDSIIVTELSVIPLATSTNPQIICEGESYTINGNTYTSSGDYIDVFQAINGCDSIVTTQLTVNPTFTTNNPQTICEGDSYSINGNAYSVAGTYIDTLQAINGCDSIVSTQLTVNLIFTTNNPQTICEGESYSIGGNTYTSGGTYIDTLQSVNTCDSIVTTILTVNPTYSINNPQTICEGDSYSIGGNTYTSGGTYQTPFQSINGCDSIINTILTVNTTYAVNNPQTICEGAFYSIGTSTYTVSGTYIDTLQSMNGCDSIVSTILTISNPTLNTNVSIVDLTLSSLENNATYQWLDCNNNNIEINGVNGQSFTATSNGSYAVELTSLSCGVIDTSLCFVIDNVGIENLISNLGVQVYPNPTNSSFTIESKTNKIESIRIFDATGKLVFEQKLSQNKVEIDAQKWSDGVYWIEIETGKGLVHEKVIKQ
jgi:hypothetical protein